MQHLHEHNILASELLVDLLVHLDLICRGRALGEKDLDKARAISAESNTLASDLVRVYNVLENGVVDSSEGTAVWTLLLQLTGRAVLLADDTALSNDDNGAATKLLLELLNEGTVSDHLLEDRELRDWDKDGDGLLGSRELDLLGRADLNLTEAGAKALRVNLKLVKSLGDLVLEEVWLLLEDFVSGSEHDAGL